MGKKLGVTTWLNLVEEIKVQQLENYTKLLLPFHITLLGFYTLSLVLLLLLLLFYYFVFVFYVHLHSFIFMC